jgi:hypothetical protein
MVQHKRDGFYGFAFPGRTFRLFGTFYEMLGMAVVICLTPALNPIFNSEAGGMGIDLSSPSCILWIVLLHLT